MPSATWIHPAARSIDLRAERISAVIWATGFGVDRSWLPAAALNTAGEPDQVRGVGGLPGLYFLGLRWQHRRSSHTLDGFGLDAEYLGERIAARLMWAEVSDELVAA